MKIKPVGHSKSRCERERESHARISAVSKNFSPPKNCHHPQNAHSEYVGLGPRGLGMRLSWNMGSVSLPWAFSFYMHANPLCSLNGFWWLFEYALETSHLQAPTLEGQGKEKAVQF